MSKLFTSTSLFFLVVVVVALVSINDNFVSVAAATKTPYNSTEATRAWYFCKVNSCNPSQIMNGFNCPACKDIERLYGETLIDLAVFYHEKALAHGWVGYSPQRNQIVVSFRGTRSIQWFYDFDFKYAPLPAAPSKSATSTKASSKSTKSSNPTSPSTSRR